MISQTGKSEKKISHKAIVRLDDLREPEMVFLKNLDYWISRGEYGREYNGKIWIYNTLEQWAEQIGVSKSTFRRLSKKLRDKEIVETAYLSFNKRNRTLYYTINYEKLNQKIEEVTAKRKHISKFQRVLKILASPSQNEQMIEHMGEHMNIQIHFQKIHKSYKSDKSKNVISEKVSDEQLQESNKALAKEAILEQVPKEKPQFVQKMIQILEKYYPELMKTVRLTKTIARNLVAALKYKFHGKLEAWERYLRLIKTSSYLMSEKFKLSIYWILKFLTIDRILNHEFGVNPDKITLTDEEKQKMVEDKKQQIQQKIAEINEPEICKQARVKVLKTIGVEEYQRYFANINRCRFIFSNGKMITELLGIEPWNFIFIAHKLEKIGVKTEWINDCVEIAQGNGCKTFCNAKSFEELDMMNTLNPQKGASHQDSEDNSNLILIANFETKGYEAND